MRRFTAGGVLLLAALTSTGCGVRIDTPPPAIPSPAQSEVVRSETVATSIALADAAQEAGHSSSHSEVVADLLTQIAAGSRAHAEALGGVWIPPERPTPIPTTHASLAPEATTPAGLAAALAVASQEAVQGAQETEGDERTLLTSIAVWRALAANELAAAVDGAEPEVGDLDLAGLEISGTGDVSELVRELDSGAFTYETLAARSDDATRRVDWPRRAAALRTAAQVLASADGTAGTANDPRESIYDVGPLLDLDPDVVVASLESRLATLWVSSDVPPSVRVSAAVASLELAAQTAPLAPLDSPAAVLPGLTAG